MGEIIPAKPPQDQKRGATLHHIAEQDKYSNAQRTGDLVAVQRSNISTPGGSDVEVGFPMNKDVRGRNGPEQVPEQCREG
jgi:hypothetical protein